MINGTVVLLHSGGMSSRQWKKLNERLASDVHVIAPDSIGSGENTPWPPDLELHWSQDVDVIEKLVADTAGPVHLVGHSYGGLVAITVARKHPERIASLVAYDPVAWGVIYGRNDAEGLANVRALEGSSFRDPATGGNEEWLENFVDWWNVPGSWKAMAPPGQAAFRKTARTVFWQARSLSADRTPVEAYANITAPSLFITGEKTPGAAQRVVAILAETLPNARMERVAGAGHMGPITHAADVNERIVEHITKAANAAKT